MQITLIRHSGLNAWFDKLTTLSEVEGESWGFSEFAATGCRIESGMTGRKIDFFRFLNGILKTQKYIDIFV